MTYSKILIVVSCKFWKIYREGTGKPFRAALPHENLRETSNHSDVFIKGYIYYSELRNYG